MNLLSFSSVMSTILSVLLAVFILLAMITVHEFGHYLAGKALKFKINEFAIGFGPKLFKHTSKKSGEVFSLRLLPLGGFCAFEGEDEEAENKDAFNNKAPWKRIIVLIAGPLMNYVLALLLILVSLSAFGQMCYKVNGVAPADESYIGYTFEEGDIILEADGARVYLATDVMSAVNGKKKGECVNFTVDRNGEVIALPVKLRADAQFKSSADIPAVWNVLGIGTYMSDDGVEYYSLSVESYRFGFFQTIGHSFVYSGKIAGTVFRVVGELLTGRMGLNAVGGPVTTIKTTSEIASQSLQSFLEIAAYIGVNLAIFNLLPIPALDGSKVVFCLIEWIFRKPVPRKIEAIIHAAGFVLILCFAVLVDVLQFI